MPYSPRQVSDMLQIPASSLRRLSKDFSDQLSRQKSRHRQYTESDIDILKRVREMTASGMTLTAVKTELTIVTPDQPEQPAPVDTLALIPTISHELTRLDDVTRSIILEFEQIRNDHKATVDRLQRLEAWSRLAWWKRLFTRPPEA